jgi:hypothetical protein
MVLIADNFSSPLAVDPFARPCDKLERAPANDGYGRVGEGFNLDNPKTAVS